MCSVRGIGVALIARQSMFVFNVFSFSLSFTPNRCSSSIIISPRFLKMTSFCRIRCVPIIMSISPLAIFEIIFFCSVGETNLESCAIVTGKFLKRSWLFSKCCSARIVVGARNATCFPPITALNAARIAISVFP